MSISLFFKNIRYLFRYNLKEIYKNTQGIHYAIDHVKYEIEEDIKNIPNITIKNNDATLEKLINSNCSLSRFGDGEICLIYGTDIPSQKANKILSQKLKDILINNDKNLMVGIFPIRTSLYGTELPFKKFTREVMGQYNDNFCKLLKENIDYYSTGFTFPYIHTGNQNNKHDYLNNYYKKFQQLWDGKDIVIVCGNRVFKNVKYNIYDNAKSIEYIYGPTNNAFKDYDKILNEVANKDKSKIIVLILGATATVMAAELAQKGFRALDLGHLGKDYDAFMKQEASSTDKIFKFFSPE